MANEYNPMGYIKNLKKPIHLLLLFGNNVDKMRTITNTNVTRLLLVSVRLEIFLNQISSKKFVFGSNFCGTTMQSGCRNLSREILAAVRKGNDTFFKELRNIQGNIDIPDWHDNNNSALQKCVHAGDVAGVELLLKNGADPLYENAMKDCSLHQAASLGYLKILKILYQHLGNYNALKRPGWFRYRPSHFAAVEGKTDILEWLLNQKVDVDVRDDDDYTPLHLATWEGHVDCIRLLLRNDASLNAVSKRGQTAHDIAVEVGHSEVADILAKADNKVYITHDLMDVIKKIVEFSKFPVSLQP
ncbi:Ankyrin-3 [Trichoplax sp. H2]|nr:Ankyrin-3 [Trichoplax sp. H2]|eukprot:RDD41858.1 Ankyrin-3 [Trichoplax sp. H2]